ncbi:homeobox-leucine zipper protein ANTHOCYANINLESS 2-like [Silene latifolia]|uniref:homeobox-leucine zipper protein ANTHOCYANINLESS 2-like n=1 Tax=Silene latifolia TaxID=37657 RepID=UPI003D76EF76
MFGTYQEIFGRFGLLGHFHELTLDYVVGKMEGQGEMGNFGDELDANNMMVIERDDSGSNDSKGTSQSNGSTSKGKSKKYHRHTPKQIEDLENFFANCAHPDEKQRLEIARRLGLHNRQVKFWFQNRRTQMKSQIERHENVALKQQYDKLRLENIALRDIIRNPLCQNCGGPAMLADGIMDDYQVRIENVRLKEELIRVNTIVEKFMGRPISDLANQIMASTSANSNLSLSTSRSGLNGLGLGIGPGPGLGLGLMGLNLENGVSSNSHAPMNGSIMISEYEKTIFMQAGIAAMDELLALAQADSPLWFKGLDESRELLNNEEYAKKFSPFMGIRPISFTVDATRETSSVYISSLELVDTMMFPKRWKDMFPCLVGKASTIEVLFIGNNGTRDGELQLMNAEMIFPSPFVPVRQEKFIRFAKKHSEGMWAVVDVSLDVIRESSYSASSFKWRRLPSGCIIQDIANGYSVVTWIEHSEYDENCIHQLYQPLMRSGLAFGAKRWLATLQRERECVSVFMSSGIIPEDTDIDAVCQEGKKSVMKLMKRISNALCTALSASSSSHWEKLHMEGLAADVSIMNRVSINEPGEPSGLVLSAATSVWLPLPRQHLFDFLKDEKQRGKWDILANGGPMEVITYLPKSQDGINSVSLLCPPAAPPRERNMLILQEAWSDKTGCFIVYAPVDSQSMESVLQGADSDYLALLPSGFAITDGPILPNVPTLAGNGSENSAVLGGASVLTMGFQILVSSLPTNKLTVESIETVNNLMSCTIQKIRASIGIN